MERKARCGQERTFFGDRTNKGGFQRPVVALPSTRPPTRPPYHLFAAPRPPARRPRLGPPGVGKTHLAVAIGLKAIEAGYSTLFLTAAGLIAQLDKAERENRLDEELKRLCGPKLLIVDELGYLPLGRNGANLVFQLVSRRYERHALLITSNKAFGQWGQVFGDDMPRKVLVALICFPTRAQGCDPRAQGCDPRAQGGCDPRKWW